MQSSVADARYITLKEASRLIPGRPHLNTIRRWCSKRGYRGIVLESWRLGNTRVTSVEAIDRFFEQTTGVPHRLSKNNPERPLSARHKAAEAQLDDMGVK